LGRYARAGSFREGKQHKFLLPRHKLFTKPIGRAGRLKHLPVHPFIFLKRVDSLDALWRQPCALTEAAAKKASNVEVVNVNVGMSFVMFAPPSGIAPTTGVAENELHLHRT
jgi:hypothetical protein